MTNLEIRCLEKLDKILSKFDLKIDIINFGSLNVWQYRLVDNLSDNTNWKEKLEWLGLWSSLNELLFDRLSIFECLESFERLKSQYNTANDVKLLINSQVFSTYKRYSNAYQCIQPLKSNSLEEFLIKCDLIGI